MELVTLDSRYQESGLVENYDSLVWAERFNTVGDFELQTGDVSRFMQALPEGQVVSLRDSNVPMIVETHRIVRKKNTPELLTIKGRAFDSILDRRVSVNAVVGGSSDWTINAKIPSDVAYYIMYRICVLGVAATEDIFPPSMVQFVPPSDYLSSPGADRPFTVPRGNLLSTVLTYLQTESDYDSVTNVPEVVQHGLRAVRPTDGGTAVAIEVYKAVDRSETLYFDATRDMLDDGSYLFSKVGSATSAYVVGEKGAIKLNSSGSARSGFNRRVILVDGSTSGVSDIGSLTQQGSASLAEAHETALFDGSINQDLSSYVYNKDYGLGDIVKLVGDYGLERKARVTEFLRSEDKTGSKAYPTLTTLKDDR